MLHLIFIIIGVIYNGISLWFIRMFFKERDGVTWKNYLKCFVGAPVGCAASLLFFPIDIPNLLLFTVMGGLLGELGILFTLAVKQAGEKNPAGRYSDSAPDARFFITGDKHRRFAEVKKFCRVMETKRSDVLIVLGDTGFNYYGDKRDDKLKREISALGITLFCLHGNKENRPQNVGSYGIRDFCGGKVYYEPRYPNLYFAMDGEIYTFEGRKYMVVGGAHSVDKMRCLEEGKPFWEDEMPDGEVRRAVENRLQKEGNKIYGMLTHTCPIRCLPTEMFVSTRQSANLRSHPHRATTMKKSKKFFKPDIDRSTEMWLGELEQKLEYEAWFCGHYHIDKRLDKVRMMYHDIRPLHSPPPEDTPCPT